MKDRRKNGGRRYTDNIVYLHEVLNAPSQQVIDLLEWGALEARHGLCTGASLVLLRPGMRFAAAHAGTALNYPEFAMGAIEQLKVKLYRDK